jgi:hypothetical protein
MGMEKHGNGVEMDAKSKKQIDTKTMTEKEMPKYLKQLLNWTPKSVKSWCKVMLNRSLRNGAGKGGGDPAMEIGAFQICPRLLPAFI